MNEHVHILVFTDERDVICADLGCDFRLSWVEANRRINATERLSAVDAREISGCIYDEWNSDEERLLAYADILEGNDG